MHWRLQRPRLPSSALRAGLCPVALCTGLRAQCVKGAVHLPFANGLRDCPHRTGQRKPLQKRNNHPFVGDGSPVPLSPTYPGSRTAKDPVQAVPPAHTRSFLFHYFPDQADPRPLPKGPHSPLFQHPWRLIPIRTSRFPSPRGPQSPQRVSSGAQFFTSWSE